MAARLAVALQAIRHLREPRAFYQRDGKLTSASTLRSWMQRAQARAGLPLTSGIHILRHTFCSHLAMRGAPVRAIQELAGHADLSTTMRYMHLSPA
jgi:site-specific recombinase XerD